MPQTWRSGRFLRFRLYIFSGIEFLSEAGTEGSVVEAAPLCSINGPLAARGAATSEDENAFADEQGSQP